MSTESDIIKNARIAIDQHLPRITYPILYSDGTRLISLGSAVLFEHLGRHFLLTAKHIFGEYPGERFPYEGLVGPRTRTHHIPSGLGRITALEPKGDDADFLDIIALEIHEEETVEAIRREWSFLTVADIGTPSGENVHIVAGYPKDRERKVGETIGAAFMTVTTEKYPTLPQLEDDRVDPAFDLFLKYADEAINQYHGDREETPWPGGVSGGGAFRVPEDPPVFWTPKTGLRLVGIQSGASRAKQWLRIKNTHAILSYFKKASPDIASAIADHLRLPI